MEREPGTKSLGVDGWRAMSLLWLSGMGLRITILAVPPVIQMIRSEFRLTGTEIGMLSGIPLTMFALNALGGSLLAARLGVLRALLGGLALVAAGSALRGTSGGFGALFLTTVLMSAGVAIMQPVLPVCVRQWVPTRVALGTAVYSNGLLVGELLPVWLTASLVMPLIDGSWRAALAVWSVPVAITAVCVALFAPRAGAGTPSASTALHRWMPDWRGRIVWRIGGALGAVSGMYFSTNAFLPGFLAAEHRPDLVHVGLTALNLGQIPASLLMLAFANRLQRRVWPFYVVGVLALVGTAGLAFDVGSRTAAYAFVCGFADASVLILSLGLPPLLCRGDDVGRTSAGIFMIGYGSSVGVALLCGAFWDLTGHAGSVFVPLFVCAAVLLTAAFDMRRHGELA